MSQGRRRRLGVLSVHLNVHCRPDKTHKQHKVSFLIGLLSSPYLSIGRAVMKCLKYHSCACARLPPLEMVDC